MRHSVYREFVRLYKIVQKKVVDTVVRVRDYIKDNKDSIYRFVYLWARVFFVNSIVRRFLTSERVKANVLTFLISFFVFIK